MTVSVSLLVDRADEPDEASGAGSSGMSVCTFVSIVFASEPKLRRTRTGSSWSAIALRKQRCRAIRV